MLCEVKAGNGVEVTVTFTDKSGALADPTTASVVVLDPDGVETTYSGGELSHIGAGVYTVDFAPAIPGKWWVKGVGSGNVVAVDEDFILVIATKA